MVDRLAGNAALHTSILYKSYVLLIEFLDAPAILKPVGFVFQGCFRQDVTVVTIYASLGEDALVHSLNEVRKHILICSLCIN